MSLAIFIFIFQFSPLITEWNGILLCSAQFRCTQSCREREREGESEISQKRKRVKYNKKTSQRNVRIKCDYTGFIVGTTQRQNVIFITIFSSSFAKNLEQRQIKNGKNIRVWVRVMAFFSKFYSLTMSKHAWRRIREITSASHSLFLSWQITHLLFTSLPYTLQTFVTWSFSFKSAHSILEFHLVNLEFHLLMLLQIRFHSYTFHHN